MPYPKEFPQQLLGLGPSFSRDDLKKGMGAAIKKNPKQSAKYTAAFHELSNPRKRLEYEVLLPQGNEDMERELEELLAALGRKSYLPEDCPPLPAASPLALLTPADIEADFTDMEMEPPRVALSDRYDNLKQVPFPIFFDR